MFASNVSFKSQGSRFDKTKICENTGGIFEAFLGVKRTFYIAKDMLILKLQETEGCGMRLSELMVFFPSFYYFHVEITHVQLASCLCVEICSVNFSL